MDDKKEARSEMRRALNAEMFAAEKVEKATAAKERAAAAVRRAKSALATAETRLKACSGAENEALHTHRAAARELDAARAAFGGGSANEAEKPEDAEE
jgi:hypothetical protein